MLLFFILACDTLILYRVRWQTRQHSGAQTTVSS
jgi:hypothetical protein